MLSFPQKSRRLERTNTRRQLTMAQYSYHSFRASNVSVSLYFSERSGCFFESHLLVSKIGNRVASISKKHQRLCEPHANLLPVILSSVFAAGSTPGWYENLPTSVQTDLVPSRNSTLPSGTGVIVNSNSSSLVVTKSSTTITKPATPKAPTTTGGGSGDGSGGGSGGGSGSDNGSASSSSFSDFAVPTAVVGAGLAGVVGLVGLFAL